MTPEDRSCSQTPGESYGGLLEGVGPTAGELSLVALVNTVMSRALYFTRWENRPATRQVHGDDPRSVAPTQ